MRVEKNNYSEKQRKLEKEKPNYKQELLNKIKSGNRVHVPDIVKDSTDEEKYKVLYKRLKKDLERLKKDNNNLKNDFSSYKKEEYKKEINLNELKGKLQEQYILIEKLKKEKNDLITFKNELLTKNEDIENQLKKKIKELVTLASNHAILTNKLKDLNFKNNVLRKNNDYLQSEYKENILLQLNEKEQIIKKLENKNKSLEIKNLYLEEELCSYKTLSPDYVLKILYNNMTTDNFKDYSFSHNLNRKYKLIKKGSYLHKSTNNNIFEKEKLYGHVKKIEDSLLFLDLNLIEYPIRNINGYWRKNDPVLASLNEDKTVDILWIFESNEDMKNEISYEKESAITHSKKIEEDKQQYEYIGNFKVLIITSKFGHKYSKRLSDHGIQSEYIDAYEKSPIHIRESIKSADIVLMCVDHMPHFVNDYVNNDNQKFQYLTNHNEEIIVIRTKFAAKQLGII